MSDTEYAAPERECGFPRAKPIILGRRALVMGIVNMTPDSFSGRNAAGTVSSAVDMALAMLSSGADMVDIGAESSRPGAESLAWEQETERLGDVVARLRGRTDAPISVDTYHPETARHALEQGADIVNDIAALRGDFSGGSAAGDARHDAGMARIAAKAGAVVVLMHMKGTPGMMQNAPAYAGDVVDEVRAFLEERAAVAGRAGIPEERIWLDPGFGFGKNFSHNRALLLRLGEMVRVGCPVLAGMSRKRMIADALGESAGTRLEASLALAVMAALRGADIVRVHDVPETARALRMTDAILRGTVYH